MKGAAASYLRAARRLPTSRDFLLSPPRVAPRAHTGTVRLCVEGPARSACFVLANGQAGGQGVLINRALNCVCECELAPSATPHVQRGHRIPAATWPLDSTPGRAWPPGPSSTALLPGRPLFGYTSMRNGEANAARADRAEEADAAAERGSKGAPLLGDEGRGAQREPLLSDAERGGAAGSFI